MLIYFIISKNDITDMLSSEDRCLLLYFAWFLTFNLKRFHVR